VRKEEGEEGRKRKTRQEKRSKAGGRNEEGGRVKINS